MKKTKNSDDQGPQNETELHLHLSEILKALKDHTGGFSVLR